MTKKKSSTVQEIPMKLPKVGDRLMRVMTASGYGSPAHDTPEPCVVIYVNKRNNHYTVRFVETNLRESYKLPDVDEIGCFKQDYKLAFGRNPTGVYIYESGMLYPSVSECAKALDVRPCTISNHLHGRTRHVKGYHIYLL